MKYFANYDMPGICRLIYRNTNCNFKVNISIDLIASFLFSILKYKQNLANRSKLNGLWLLYLLWH